MTFAPRIATLFAFITLIALASSPFIFQTLRIDLHAHLSNLYGGPKAGYSTVTTGARANFSWESVPPSDHLVWHDCYAEHQCARLNVPLDYSDPHGEKAIIAMTRIPSPLSVDSPWYRGPILFNPGGPGGSGVDLIARMGKALSTIVGPQFDVLGFDPRGVGNSVPRVSFFETAAERVLWAPGSLHVLGTSSDDVAREWARSKITNELARERQLEVLKHINTDQTARDMLRITEAHGKEKLQYWGFSYGTVLGATFAAMFPDKIERMIIDGVVDVENYYATLWTNNLLDTDKTMQSFFEGCVAAGPDDCPFYAPTAEDISRNLTNLYDAVRRKPVPVRTKLSYGLVDYNRLRTTIFTTLYKPFATFATLARGLADLAAGDGRILFELTETPPFQCACDDGLPDVGVTGEAQAAILCNDGADISDSLEDFQKYFKHLTHKSSWGELWSTIRANCIGWPKLPKTHYRGPFIGNTSFPILLIGNTADPVTPLWAAKKTSKGYPGSVVLTQDSPGHCSLAAPSLCTQKYVRAYFTEGTLPDKDTVCGIIGSPFSQPAPKATADQMSLQHNLTPDEYDILASITSLSMSHWLSVSHPL
ncbi:TAP-like protein-domain-containing protein [Collybia nuda]|uniref:TAP-like protein-domain-containing protein n=1 Tax=Collybia nuda TaxID=64659 RepID=A0A9P6CDN7_9AGAR|nr:TAP-like protein-domain-containing protein [Collybia nuda]